MVNRHQVALLIKRLVAICLVSGGLTVMVFLASAMLERLQISQAARNHVLGIIRYELGRDLYDYQLPQVRTESLSVQSDVAEVTVKVFHPGEWVRMTLSMERDAKLQSRWQVVDLRNLESYPEEIVQSAKTGREETETDAEHARIEAAFQGFDGVDVSRVR